MNLSILVPMSAAQERLDQSNGVVPTYTQNSLRRDLTLVPSRPRGDSIYLPPPIPYEQLAPLRSNLIFSLLINMPPLNQGSVLQPGGQAGDKRQRLSNGFSEQVLAEEIDLIINKDLFGKLLMDILLWDPMAPGLILGPGGSSQFQAMPQSGSFSDMLQSMISLGLIDFTGMSQEQRRDLILKMLNDPAQRTRFLNSVGNQGQTRLKEDIFGLLSQHSSNLASGLGANLSPDGRRDGDKDRLSPTLLMLLNPRREEPQLPRTLPQYSNQPPPSLAFTAPLPPPQRGGQQNHSGIPQQSSGQMPVSSGYPQYQGFANVPGANNANDIMYRQNLFSGLQGQQQYGMYAPQQAQYLSKPSGQGQATASSPSEQQSPDLNGANVMNLTAAQAKQLVPAQQYVKLEDGRPLLGATKIDQLMLVIQAREKGITKPIEQAPDGLILGAPNYSLLNLKSELDRDVLPRPVSLVGGVDKPKSMEDEHDTKRRKKGKQQQCPYCFKYFTQLTHLEVHIRLHIGYKPFKCHYCNKKFTQGGNLRTHLRLHTGEKPFTCDTCNRLFSRKGNLAAHKLTHENLKPFSCKLDGCDKLFTQLGNLKLHQNRFHLATLNELTHKLAEMNGEQLANLPEAEKEMLDYFKKLYKNSNKGIRGRGKQTKIITSAESPTQQQMPQLAAGSLPPGHPQYNLDSKPLMAPVVGAPVALPRQQNCQQLPNLMNLKMSPGSQAPGNNAPGSGAMDWGYRDQQISGGANYKRI